MKSSQKPSLPALDDQEFLEEFSRLAKNEGPYKEQFKKRLEEYISYKQFFQTVFIEPKDMKCVFRYRITYLRSEKNRPIWREIEIVGSQKLEKLAEEIIKAMGWDNDHLHAFRFVPAETKYKEYGQQHFAIMIDTEGNADSDYPEHLTNKVQVSQINYEKFPQMHFEFDFGDSHEFTVEFKGIRALGRKEMVSQFPRLIDQRGVAPEQYPGLDEEDEEVQDLG